MTLRRKIYVPVDEPLRLYFFNVHTERLNMQTGDNKTVLTALEMLFVDHEINCPTYTTFFGIRKLVRGITPYEQLYIKRYASDRDSYNKFILYMKKHGIFMPLSLLQEWDYLQYKQDMRAKIMHEILTEHFWSRTWIETHLIEQTRDVDGVKVKFYKPTAEDNHNRQNRRQAVHETVVKMRDTIKRYDEYVNDMYDTQYILWGFNVIDIPSPRMGPVYDKVYEKTSHFKIPFQDWTLKEQAIHTAINTALRKKWYIRSTYDKHILFRNY